MQDPEYVGKSGLDEAGFYKNADKGDWKSFVRPRLEPPRCRHQPS